MSCSVYRYDSYDDFNEKLKMARDGWKKNKPREKVEFYFKELVWWSEVRKDYERMAWSFHEWGRYRLSKKDWRRAEELFIKSKVNLVNNKIYNPVLSYFNNFNLAFLSSLKTADIKNSNKLKIQEKIICTYLRNSRDNILQMKSLDFVKYYNHSIHEIDGLQSKFEKEKFISEVKERQNKLCLKTNCTLGVI